MFESLLQRIFAPTPQRLPDPDARLALAALLVRVARTDGLYAVEEVEKIDRILMARHGFGPFEAARLRAEAETLESEAPDTVRFTRALKSLIPLEERSDLLTALWQVALADTTRDAEEDRLLRMVANLLGLTDVENAKARQKADRA